MSTKPKNKAAQELAKLSHKRYKKMSPCAKKAQTAAACEARKLKRERGEL